jgi:hypothetical protein
MMYYGIKVCRMVESWRCDLAWKSRVLQPSPLPYKVVLASIPYYTRRGDACVSERARVRAFVLTNALHSFVLAKHFGFAVNANVTASTTGLRTFHIFALSIINHHTEDKNVIWWFGLLIWKFLVAHLVGHHLILSDIESIHNALHATVEYYSCPGREATFQSRPTLRYCILWGFHDSKVAYLSLSIAWMWQDHEASGYLNISYIRLTFQHGFLIHVSDRLVHSQSSTRDTLTTVLYIVGVPSLRSWVPSK